MAKRTTKKHDKIDFKKIKFVIDNLTKDHMKAFDANPPAPVDILDGIHNLAEEGASVSVKFDHWSGKGYLASATFNMTNYQNSGYAISARGSDVTDALGILLYKYFTVAERDLSLWDYGKEEGFTRG